MSQDYPQQDVGTNNGRRGLGIIDTLQSLRQNVETAVRQSRFEISGSQVDQIDAPEELDEYVDYAKRVGFVWKALDIFANDVWEPGYRLEGPEETRAYFLGDVEDVDAQPPEGTPEGGFLDNAAVYAGEKHQDFYDFGKATTIQRWLRGTVLIELLKADEDDPDSEITGFYFVRPETVSAEVYPNTNILIDPEDTDQPGVEITKRGEAAAYIQFDDQSILGRQGKFDDDREEIPLSQNDVNKQVLNPGIGDDADDEQGIFGTSVIEPISEDIAEYLQIKRDQATAISNKAHGFWLIEHGRDVLEHPNGDVEIIEWDDDSMDDFESKLSKVDPGGHVTYDGSVEVNREEGSVPDLSDEIQHYVQSIIAALPTPKYKIGFEDDVNRDVTSEQNSDYERVISEARQYQETQWTQTFKEVAERKGLPTEGLQFKIEPEPEDSPVLSLSETEINKLATYADALNSLAGPTGGPQTLVDAETLLTDVAQLPDASMQNAAEEMEEMDVDEETETLFRETYLDTLADTRYSEGDEVDTPDGVGVVVEVRTENFEGPDGEIEASEDSPAYVVGTEDGVGFFTASELSEGAIEVEGVDEPQDTLSAWVDIVAAEGRLDTLQDGRFDYPESWEESETPNRLILLKAWAGLGGRFTTCVREMRGELTGSPDRFCASMKDRVLGGWEGWRQGG